MSDEKKYDEETQKFYDENREMIEKILAQERAADPRMEEMLKRAAFEQKMRLEYEAEKARRAAFENMDKAYADAMGVRDKAETAFIEARDHIRSFSHDQSEYIYDMMKEQFERARTDAKRGKEFAKEKGEHLKNKASEKFEEYFTPLTDDQFQKHMVGAGLEIWMALNALVRASPLPDSIKEAFVNADRNKNKEFCVKNQDCGKRPESNEPQQIRITPVKKENE